MAQQKAVDSAIDDEADDLIDELQPGAKLLKGQYTITRYLNSGGFGITYLAKDSLDRDVVIKECFPSSFCRRSKTVVAARSRAHTAELRSIVQLFVREARNLAKIVHPNIVAVHQVFEDNGTAYMAIDYIDGLDLQQVIDGEGPRLTPEQIVHITDKLLVAVGFIHDSDMLHRDISPDNVLIDKAGEPILIDFGAAREQASKATRAMSALRVVKDGYSPQEFYIAGSEQGPWSDLYALAATLYHLISGEAPVNGQARLASLAEDRPDPYVPLTGKHAGYPPGFLEAIDLAMSTLPKQRLQSAADWRAMFKVDASPPQSDAISTAVHELVEASREKPAETADPAGPAETPTRSTSKPAEAAAVSSGSRGRSSVQLLAGVVTALVVVGAGYVMLGGTKGPAPTQQATTTEPATASVPAQTPAPLSSGEAPSETTSAKVAGTANTEVAAATPAEAPDPATEASAAPEPAAPTAEAAAAPAAETADATGTGTETAAPTGTETAQTATAEAPIADVTPVMLTPPAGKPSPNQIALAVWDVIMPFSAGDRIIGGRPVAVITRLAPGTNTTESGDWLAPGVMIHSVNNVPVPSSGSLTVAVMNAMSADPDGKARVVVDYTDATGSKQSGLLTVATIRLVNLSNGISTRTSVVDGVWTTEVTGIADPAVTTLLPGDILFRDKTTGLALDGAETFETVMAELIAKDVTQTDFSIVRDNKVAEAQMQLSIEGR